MGEVGGDKAALRARLRGVVPSPEVDAAVCAQLQALPDVGAGTVMAYLALGDEVNLDDWIGWALDRGVRVCVPRVDWDAGSMEGVLLGSLEDLTVGRYRLREPVAEAAVVPIEDMGAVLVPGLGFDMRGGRLGRGGGFYDRFLTRLPEGAARIGIAWSGRVVDRVPVEAWDQMVDMLVTERGVERFDRLQD
jgi:5-formyltetrahydrofolate cyclo-ligase